MAPSEDDLRICEALLDNSLAGCWEWRPAEKTGHLSASLLSLLGYAPGELTVDREVWPRLVHPDDLPRAALAYRNHLDSGGGMPYQLELRLLRKGGSDIWTYCAAKAAEWDERGRPSRIVGSVVDISDRKRVEENLRGALAALDRRNEELASIAFITAHDLRSPVTSIISLVDLYKEDPTPDNAVFAMEHMGMLARDLLDTLDTLSEVLNVKRRPDLVMQPVDIAPLFEGIVQEHSRLLARKKARVESDFSECPRIQSHPPYLEGILRGLLSNAIRFSHPDRPLVVHVETKSFRNSHSIRFSDNGIGIDLARHGRRIFGLQRSLHHGSDETHAAGLFVIKAQVEAMGGSISVSSEVDGGSTFTVFLPCKR